MKQERRAAPRVRADLDTRWTTGANTYDGVIHDISLTGCFIMSPEEVSKRLHVFVEIGVPRLLHMRLQGTVTRPVLGVGFGVKFNDLNATERLMLERILRQLRKRQAS